MATEHLTKQSFLEKIFNFETEQEWKFLGIDLQLLISTLIGVVHVK